MSYFSDPVRNIAAVTPSDSVTFVSATHGIYIGVAGDVAVESASGDTATFYNVPAGIVLPVQCKKILATGTSASNIVRMW